MFIKKDVLINLLVNTFFFIGIFIVCFNLIYDALLFVRNVLSVLIIIIILYNILKKTFWIKLYNGFYNSKIYHLFFYFLNIDIIYLCLPETYKEVFIISAVFFKLVITLIYKRYKKTNRTNSNLKLFWDYAWLGEFLILGISVLLLKFNYKIQSPKKRYLIKKVIWDCLMLNHLRNYEKDLVILKYNYYILFLLNFDKKIG